MISDDLGGSLHDRSTRGLPLTDEERQQLNAWYEKNDREEAEMLRRNRKPDLAGEELDTKIQATLEYMVSVLNRIQQVEAENIALRREIALLRSKLPDRITSKAA